MLWSKKLRSGEFRKTTGYLCKSQEDGELGYCCLGVLEVLDGREFVKIGGVSYVDPDNQESMPHDGYAQQFGLTKEPTQAEKDQALGILVRLGVGEVDKLTSPFHDVDKRMGILAFINDHRWGDTYSSPYRTTFNHVATVIEELGWDVELGDDEEGVENLDNVMTEIMDSKEV